MRLHYKLIIFISVLILVISSVFEIVSQEMFLKNLKHEKGLKALAISQTVANMPEVREAFLSENPSGIIQPIVEKIRKKVGAEFIVVGNKNEVRYSHPTPFLIGKKMVGGDNDKVFKGQEIVSESTGTLGPSLRGKTPIFDDNGNVIGVVSVGYLIKDIDHEAKAFSKKLIKNSIVILLLGIGVAFLISFNIKKSIFGLEPKEIGRMYKEKNAILESIHEGIIAIDEYGEITVVNENAHKVLSIPNNIKLRGLKIEDILHNSQLKKVVETGKPIYDLEFLINEKVMIINCIPIVGVNSKIVGAVTTFREKSELNKLLNELSQIKAYSEGLRAQAHEYSNKLHTILGLIQLESYQEAIELISKESNITQNIIHFIMEEISDPVVAGLLLGKISLANELKVDFNIDYNSSFADVSKDINREDLITIIGNLLNNAFDAVLETNKSEKLVSLFLTDLGEDLVIEIEDNANGIPEELIDEIFEYGISTKEQSKNSGIGLHLVQRLLHKLNGQITFHSNEHGGTTFIVAIPKRQKESNRYDEKEFNRSVNS
ncbi:sensor histidine kinase [Bacillus sp. AFS088145]|uniref:ATP-binding protein n=1 Tax=Bacillus sp. AFS088145 TaxID=2033514 RepID=UPI000BF4DA6A|nr:sensor histidine kinase [Bacillus sp. AFS088145]PFH89097.1 histidine kinase [Bacillus sp. AFS088145]